MDLIWRFQTPLPWLSKLPNFGASSLTLLSKVILFMWLSLQFTQCSGSILVCGSLQCSVFYVLCSVFCVLCSVERSVQYVFSVQSWAQWRLMTRVGWSLREAAMVPLQYSPPLKCNEIHPNSENTSFLLMLLLLLCNRKNRLKCYIMAVKHYPAANTLSNG